MYVAVGIGGLANTSVKTLPTLADLGASVRDRVGALQAQGVKLDCADLAIDAWIHFGERYRLPMRFSVRDRAKGGSRWVRRRNFKTIDAFVRLVQRDLSALGLARNTIPVPGGHRAAVAGDFFLWEYRRKNPDGSMGPRHYIGHTQIVDSITQDPNDPMLDQITIVQGTLPPEVPRHITYPASYFFSRREASIGGKPHYGVLLGSGPRRYKGFAALR